MSGLWTKSDLPAVSVKRVLLEHTNHAYLFTWCLLPAFALQRQSEPVATEVVWPAQPKIRTIRPFTAKFADPTLDKLNYSFYQ